MLGGRKRSFWNTFGTQTSPVPLKKRCLNIDNNMFKSNTLDSEQCKTIYYVIQECLPCLPDVICLEIAECATGFIINIEHSSLYANIYFYNSYNAQQKIGYIPIN